MTIIEQTWLCSEETAALSIAFEALTESSKIGSTPPRFIWSSEFCYINLSPTLPSFEVVFSVGSKFTLVTWLAPLPWPRCTSHCFICLRLPSRRSARFTLMVHRLEKLDIWSLSARKVYVVSLYIYMLTCRTGLFYCIFEPAQQRKITSTLVTPAKTKISVTFHTLVL